MHFTKMLVDRVAFQDFLDNLAPNSNIGLSIDLETWNRRGPGFHSAAIVPFDIDKNVVYDKAALVVRVRLETLLKFPDMLDPSTIRWWMTEPSQEARDELFAVYSRDSKGKCTYAQGLMASYTDACIGIVDYMREITTKGATIQPLGNGAIFDVGKLEASLVQTGAVDGGKENPFPYAFWHIRDLREIINGARMATGRNVKKEVMLEGTSHKCLDDAIVQARQALAAEQLMLDARETYTRLLDATRDPKAGLELALKLLGYNIEVVDAELETVISTLTARKERFYG